MDSTTKQVDKVLPSAQGSFKKRKKRSLIQQVNKRFKKSASFSKGAVFDGNQYEYFMRVFKLEHQFEGSIEEKTIFANNSLAQTEGQEIECSFNQLISRVIEKLIPLASNEVLERFFKVFGLDLRPICVHDYASHVLQTLMITAARRSTGEDGVADSSHNNQCKTWLIKVSRYLLNNIEEFMWDKHASYTLKTAMLCLAGLPHLDKHDTTKESRDEKPNPTESVQQPIIVPLEFKNLLEEFFTQISNLPQLKDLVHNPLSSVCLQTLLRVLKPTHKKKFKSLCNKILAECFPSSSDEHYSTMYSPTALPVLEVIMELSKGKMLQKIYDQCIAGRLVKMSTTRISHITIQKFLNNSNKPEMVAGIVNALAPEFNTILASKTDIVLVSMCRACERLKTSQSEFLKALTTTLNCATGDAETQIVPAVLSLTPLPHEAPPPLNKHGSLLIQSLLRFQKPIKLVNSLLLYEPKELADLLTSTYGSHITTAFCKSEFIGGKSHHKLIKKLVGHYPSMAASTFGSRSFDDIWEVAELKNKELIVKDLASDFSQVMKTKCGQFVASKVKLDDFRTQGIDKWRQKLQSIQSKKKLFAEIINKGCQDS